MIVLERWESQKGKYWAEFVEYDSGGYGARFFGASSIYGNKTISEAYKQFLYWVKTPGFALPDNAKKPMTRVFRSNDMPDITD